MDAIEQEVEKLKTRGKLCFASSVGLAALWFYSSVSVIVPKIASIEDVTTRGLYGALMGLLAAPALVSMVYGHNSELRAMNLEHALKVYRDLKT